jgi:putative heme-binding domain-containing protein
MQADVSRFHARHLLDNFGEYFMRASAHLPAALSLLVLSVAWGSLGVSPPTARGEVKAQSPRPAWTTSKLRGQPVPPEPYRIESKFPKLKFQKPTSVEQLPGTQRLLVTEMGGRVYTIPRDSQVTTPDLAFDLVTLLPADAPRKSVSLFDAEPHPQFAQNRQIFLCYVHPGDGGHTRVSRFTLDASQSPRLVSGSEQVIITWPSGGHNAGCLEFGKDGYLYASTGDGSGPNPPDGLTTGQTVDDLLGAVLRIDVDHASNGRQYSVPADNPFVELAGARPEIWSYGLRNPFKFGVDPKTGDVFVADNGWETWEMIHKLSRGSNCGWPVMEGRVALRSEVAVGPTPIVPPVKDHPHTEANSVIGGPVYRGSKLPQLDGAFVYGDYITGTLWAIRPDREGSYTCDTLLDTDLRIVGFTQTTDGEMLVLDYDFTGQIYELLPSNVEDLSASFPRRLSETGLFASVERLEPAPGVVPYSVRAARWDDGASAKRWIAIPGDATVRLASVPDGEPSFPEGTVLVKHLEWPVGAGQPAIRLETQLLHLERGVWRPYSYLWDELNRDATLVDSTGAARTLPAIPAANGVAAIPERTWHVNATNECKLCHNAGPKFVLGFTLAQLDRPDGVSSSSSPTSSQLARLTSQRVIAGAESLAASDPARLVDPHDATQSLDDRARSYLHANCAMCHHPGGNAIVSFYLRRDLPFDKLNTNKGTGIGTFGMRDAKLIVPGDPYRSVLMYRMSKLGYARMPYIGSRVVDGQGVALIDQWIRSLPHEASQKLSDPATASSSTAMSLARLAEAGKSAASTSGDREQAIAELVKTTEGSLALIALLHRRSLTPTDTEKAISVGSAAPSDIRGLFETFVPEGKRRATLGANFDPRLVLDRTGDRERGKLIFFSDGARCRNCHELDDREKSLGPTLREIVKKYPKADELLRHVVQPSLKIDEPFAAYTVVVDDGRVLTGLAIEQSDKQVVLKTAERQLVRIPRDSIEEMRRSEKSLMPDRVLGDLTAQEAADLFAYLRSIGQ